MGNKNYSYMSILVINMWFIILLYIFLHLKTYFQKHTEPQPQLLSTHKDLSITQGNGGADNTKV